MNKPCPICCRPVPYSTALGCCPDHDFKARGIRPLSTKERVAQDVDKMVMRDAVKPRHLGLLRPHSTREPDGDLRGPFEKPARADAERGPDERAPERLEEIRRK